MTSLIDIPLSQIQGLNQVKALVIGGTGGLGRSITQVLSDNGVEVTVVGRTFRDQGKPNIKFIKADLSSIKASQQLAKHLDVSNTDIVLFTTGIFSGRTRQETEEGLEVDLATSYLNRLAILETIGKKLTHNSPLGVPRVFIMGFPGNKQLGVPDDLNQEKSYGFYAAHMNTVAGNEALVLNSAKEFPNLRVFGINPGIVKTNIRSNLYGDGFFARTFESFLSWFTPSSEKFAETLVPALVSPELNKYNGVHIDRYGYLLQPSDNLTQKYADDFIKKSKELLRSKGL